MNGLKAIPTKPLSLKRRFDNKHSPFPFSPSSEIVCFRSEGGEAVVCLTICDIRFYLRKEVAPAIVIVDNHSSQVVDQGLSLTAQ